MKAELRGKVVEESHPVHPYLGKITEQGNNLVVLFTSPRNGVVVIPDKGWILGDMFGSWVEESFYPLPLSQEVVLKNG